MKARFSRLLSTFVALFFSLALPAFGNGSAAYAAGVQVLSATDEDLDLVVEAYEDFTVLFQDAGLEAAVTHTDPLRGSSLAELEGAFAGRRSLPELVFKGEALILREKGVELARWSLADLRRGDFRLGDQRLELREGLSFREAYAKLRAEKVGWFDRAGRTLSGAVGGETAHAAAILPIVLAVGALIAAIFGGMKWAQNRKAERAREAAVREKRPLGPDSVYPNAPTAPSHIRGTNLVERVAARAGIPTRGSKSEPGKPSASTTATEVNKARETSKGRAGCDSEFNQRVLAQLPKIEDEVRRRGKTGESGRKNGGYSMADGKGGYNVGVTLGDNTISQGTRSHSHCTSASYTAFMWALDEHFRAHGKVVSSTVATHFAVTKADNYGGHGAFWNNYGGPADLADYFDNLGVDAFDRESDPARLCAGDVMKFDRRSGNGHSAIFLYSQVVDGKRELCFWSSNKNTEGYGVKCEPADQIVRYRALKVKDPAKVLTLAEAYGGGSRESAYKEKSTADASADHALAAAFAKSTATPEGAPGAHRP